MIFLCLFVYLFSLRWCNGILCWVVEVPLAIFFANDAQFAFRRVDQPACWIVGEVFFMVFKGDEGLLMCDAFGPVVYLEISCY